MNKGEVVENIKLIKIATNQIETRGEENASLILFILQKVNQTLIGLEEESNVRDK